MDLTPRERQALDLLNSTDPVMSYQEIANQMGITYCSASNTIKRAKRKPVSYTHLTLPTTPYV